jgi:iron complex outermembrane recepter protein
MRSISRTVLMCLASTSIVALPEAASAQTAAELSIPAQPLGQSLTMVSKRTGVDIVFVAADVAQIRAPAIRGRMDAMTAVRRLIGGKALSVTATPSGALVVRPAAKPVPAPRRVDRPQRRPAAPVAVAAAQQAPQDAADDSVNPAAIVVTARRMEERIIDVPSAVSVLSAQQLNEKKIEGGPELLRGIPNVNFSKDNFSGYNFAIRGVGTKTVSTTADPSVAVDFNNTTLLRNRLFEQEYFDVQRVEVLRGPQGTLYGRNATAGVVNMLPNLPKLNDFSGDILVEAGNYDSRRARGYVNIPLGDTLAFRAAGAYTKRDGFDYNTVTQNRVNGRDLYSFRLSGLWEPSDHFQANFIWEHFKEKDNRSRTGKQLCTRGEAPTSVSYTDLDGNAQNKPINAAFTKGALTPGCQAKSLFTDEAYSTPNGIGFPITLPLITTVGFNGRGGPRNDTYLFPAQIDPFTPAGSTEQSRDLREIATFYDPVFRAKNDIFQLNLQWAPSDGLTLYSQSLYTKDSYYASEDFFRFTPASGLMANPTGRTVSNRWVPYLGVSAAGNGAFNDPQLGLLDHLAAIDISESKSEQWAQEVRLQSAFDGPFNFTLGGNYLHFKTDESYWIFSNAFTIAAVNASGSFYSDCVTPLPGTIGTPDPTACTYVDPNPLGKLDGQGHNYYRNWNIASTESMGGFGEGYYKLSDNMRMTAGLRWTRDIKRTIPISSQLLANNSFAAGGTVGKGYPRRPETRQAFSGLTGRLVVDWKPNLSFTDDTLVYTSYSRGYKAGGGNPAGPDFNQYNAQYSFLPTTYDPERVNAFEIGTKNSFDGGRITLNATGFFYDYKNYQISQLIDRAVHTENLDAKTYGLEFEAAWAPSRRFRLDATLGLLRTRIGKGETSIDVMNRTQGRSDYYVLRPWPQSPATCIVPAQILGRYVTNVDRTSLTGNVVVHSLCPGPRFQNGGFDPGGILGQINGDKDSSGKLIPGRGLYYDPNTWIDPVTGKGINGGRGFSADLSGNELPNAPRLTFNIGAQYRIDLSRNWDVVVRGDYYRQSASFMRIYNSDYDRLKGWGNGNIAITVNNSAGEFGLQFYVKNVFNSTPITDGFTGPDELGNYTNVFTLDPRIFGFSLNKKF